MISLKDYIVEGIFDGEDKMSKQADKEILKAKMTEVRNWVRMYTDKAKGTVKVYEEAGDFIVKFSGKTRYITIDYTKIPDDVKFNFVDSVCGKLVLNNPCDNFMERIIADSLDTLCINRAEKATTTGKVSIKSIEQLEYMINHNSKLHDLTPFKDSGIQWVFLSPADQPNLSFDVDLNGLNMDGLNVMGRFNYNKLEGPGFVVKTNGNYNVSRVDIEYGAQVIGLPSKLKELTDESWNTVLSGDAKEVDKLYLKVDPNVRFVELQDELDRLKQIISGEISLPKFKKLTFDTPYGNWKCKEKDLKDTVDIMIKGIEKENKYRK